MNPANRASKRMKAERRIGVFVIAIFICSFVFERFQSGSGVAEQVTDLSAVYRKAGIESFYTNSIFQSLQFHGPITWSWRARPREVVLQGKIELSEWRTYLILHPAVRSNWSDGSIKYGHPVADRLVISYLSVDM